MQARTLLFGLALALAAPSVQAQSGAAAEIEADRRDQACPVAQRAEASAALQAMYDADQNVRTGDAGPLGTDEERRYEVARIFASGCMSTAADFYNAAMIYQHGTVPEHYLQALVWAQRAKALGHPEADYLIPRAADRYLMNLGRKQLYGTNLISNVFLNPDEDLEYWCLWPVDDAFPAERRQAYVAAGDISSMEDQSARVAEMNGGSLPDFGAQCPLDVAPSPPGSVPGHW